MGHMFFGLRSDQEDKVQELLQLFYLICELKNLVLNRDVWSRFKEELFEKTRAVFGVYFDFGSLLDDLIARRAPSSQFSPDFVSENDGSTKALVFSNQDYTVMFCISYELLTLVPFGLYVNVFRHSDHGEVNHFISVE